MSEREKKDEELIKCCSTLARKIFIYKIVIEGNKTYERKDRIRYTRERGRRRMKKCL